MLGRIIHRVALVALAPVPVAVGFVAALGWSQPAPEVCHTVRDGAGAPVRDAAARRVLTVASAPCPLPPQVVVAAPLAAPMAGPMPLMPAGGPTLTLAGVIAFDFDSARLRPEFYPELDRIAAALRETPAERLALVGHTDAIGTERYNQGLSEQRARSVAAYLQRAGVPGGRLSTSGAGESRPVATNETAAGRARNRRVEIAAL